MNDLITSVLKDENYLQNPYFIELAKGNFTKDDFIATQIQFYYAVENFSSVMANLCARIPSPKLRLEIIRNVWEEHGDGNPENSHVHSFNILLSRLTGDENFQIEKHLATSEVLHFNYVLSGACATSQTYLTGIAVLGMIEYMFSGIAGYIGKCIVGNKWLSETELIHYNLHEKLDVKHAQDFFDLLEKPWESSESAQIEIKQGLELGAFCFNQLYKNLYQGRHKLSHYGA